MQGVVDVPEVVRAKAVAVGCSQWLDQLPALVAGIERDWCVRVGSPFPDATEAFVGPDPV
ncbi:MAG: hypothetical protein NVS3B21_35970 [Acidimicrobiales bacterium]